MARSGFVTGQIRLENNVILTTRLDREFDLILSLQKALYHARIFTHPDMIAAELTRVFQVVGIGKTEKSRDIFVDIDAVDEVLSISVPVYNEETVVYAATFKTFLRARPDQVKGQWNKAISKIREERNAMKAEHQGDEVGRNE
ncbi:MAG: hypothetical protein FWF19_05180 [Euryarchaeota archaeon]|nr:hypothetical protein [Euryarchaeota archaeon]